MGSIALISFAVCVRKLLPDHSLWAAIGAATLLWAVVCVTVWYLWKRNFLRRAFNSFDRLTTPWLSPNGSGKTFPNRPARKREW